MNIQKRLYILSVLLFSAGFSLILPIGLSWFGQSRAISSVSAATIITISNKKPAAKATTIKGVPRHISVPSLGINTSVVDGAYDATTGGWTITEDSAFYATVSDQANSEAGNTFIYGHNSQKIFGKLPNIQTNATVIVTTANGYEFTYKFIKTEAVKPTEVSVLDYSGKPRLMLQTCSGLWNQARQIFYFELINYRKV